MIRRISSILTHVALFAFLCHGERLIEAARAETTLAIFGDYGAGGINATRVAEMIRDQGTPANPWNTDYVFTTGDNQYGQIDVGHDHWDRHIGRLYGSYMKARQNPTGIYSRQTSAEQRFFPAVGNHDASPSGTGQDGGEGGILPGYLDYFHKDPDATVGRLPAGTHVLQESYYDVELPIEGGTGTIHVFVLDSNSFRTNSISRAAQTAWLESGLKNSTATWKFVTMHYPAYNSTARGDYYQMQLPYQQWGAHAVFAGHAHTYERLSVTDAVQENMPYFVSGLGGLSSSHKFSQTTPASKHQSGGNLASNGSLRVTVTDEIAHFDFLSIDDGAAGRNGGKVIDSLTLRQSNLPQAPQGNRLVSLGSEWFFLDDGSDQGTSWKNPSFRPAEAGWRIGKAQFGFGNSYATTSTSAGSNAANSFITTYFQHSFDVSAADLSRFEKLTLGLVRDEGAAVYLNGIEVRRDNLLNNAAYDLPATRFVNSNSEYHLVTTEFAVGNLLRPGTNVLAVEVHKSTIDSPDLAFDLTLDGGLIDYGRVTPGVATSFSEAALGAAAFGREESESELEWGLVSFSFNGDSDVRNEILGQSLSDNQFTVNNRNIKLVSERIDVRGVRDVKISIDYRAFTLDSSGFESTDQIQFGVQSSRDGIDFTETSWHSIVAGEDQLLSAQAVGSIGGSFSTSQSPASLIPYSAKTIKLFIRASNDSPNEYMFFDNIEVTGTRTADFNLDGMVDAKDLKILESQFGAVESASFETGDFDRDGDVDGQDLLNWQRQVETSFADFNFDGYVDAKDFAVFAANYRTDVGGSPETGDSNRDADVDGHDFLNWQRKLRINIADFTGDNRVNADDLAILESHFGMRAGASFEMGDSDRDGDVDSYDLLNWQRQYLNQLASVSASQLVPEPTTGWLWLVWTTIAQCARRTRG